MIIELTENQRQAVQQRPDQPLSLLDPITQQAYVLIRRELYESLTEYDDSPWTNEEMELLAAEVDALLDDDMAIEEADQ